MKYILTLVAILFLTGCSESSSEAFNAAATQDTSSSTQNKRVEMELNKRYEVKEGDKLYKESDDTQVKISKNSKADVSYVTLISGKAYIVFGQQQ